MKDYLFSLATFCLAISIVLGSWFIYKGLNNQADESSHKLLTEPQVATYLGISQQELDQLIPGKGREIQNTIPYIRIGTHIYFNKKAVTNWIEKDQTLSIP